MGSMNIWHWLIVLVTVVLIFGNRRIGSTGSSIESAILHFKKAVLGSRTHADIPVWLRVAVGSILFMCMLMVFEMLIS